MDKTLLVAIFVPTRTKGASQGDACLGRLATGYPVGDDLVLTVRHLFYPNPPCERDPAGSFQVRWHYHRVHPDADEQGWISLPEAAILWDGGEQLDAALLRCPRPKTAVGFGAMSETPANERDAWQSEGFPNATATATTSKPCSFGGECFSKASPEDYFELDARAPPRVEDDWRGASGMPIFVGRRIVGVAKQVPRKFKGERLHATPAWKLLADARFSDLLGIDARAAMRRALAEELIARLAKPAAEQAAKKLADGLGLARDLIGCEASEPDFARRIIDRLLETDCRSAIRTLRDAHRALINKHGRNAAQPIVAIALRLVPALFDRGVVRHAAGLRSLSLVPLPAATFTVAELIMAGVDGRAARFRQRAHVDDLPRGELDLPQHAEGGFSTDPALELAKHLNRKFTPDTESKDLRKAIDDYLVTEFARADPRAPERTPEQKIKAAAATLRRRYDDDRQTFYMVFYLPNEPKQRAPVEALVDELRKDYPALAFLGLDPDFDQDQADRDLADPLCRMLPLADPNPGESH